MFKALRGRIKGARGIEYLLAAVALALLGMAFLNGELFTSADARTDLERRLENVLGAIDGAGEVRVMVSESAVAGTFAAGEKSSRPQAEGVLVVAEGAGDLRVNMELSRAVQALLNVELSDIEIIEMRRDQS